MLYQLSYSGGSGEGTARAGDASAAGGNTPPRSPGLQAIGDAACSRLPWPFEEMTDS
jgi:hypothetical protein